MLSQVRDLAAQGHSRSVGRRLDEIAAAHPDKPALILASGPDRSGRDCYTFGDLLSASDTIARGLDSSGIRRGMRAALMVTPSFEFFALAFALLRADIVPVIVDPGIGLRNVTPCLAESQPDVFIGTTAAHIIARLFGWGRGSVRVNITAGRWGGIALDAIRRAGVAAPPFTPIDAQPDDEAAIIYTSGSTGLPKGAIYTHRNFAAQIDMLCETFDLHGDEIDLPAFPLFALIDFLIGVTSVIPDIRFPRPAQVDPAAIIRTIRQNGVTNMFGSPVVIERVSRYGAAHHITLPTLKRVITAGAPASPESLERFRRLMPEQGAIYGIYGSTESLPVACIDSREVVEETRHQTAQGAGVCIGRPVDGADVRIIGIRDISIPVWHDSLELPPGEVGEIVVKGDAATRAYIGRAEANDLAKIQDADGEILHRMGDLGYFDELGRLWYCGRKAHRVVTREQTLFTEMCEGVFNAHPQVYRTALVGVRVDDVTQPAVCVELEKHANSADREAIRRDLLNLARQHSQTRGITFILFHPGFPTDIRHNSKIIREKLSIWAGNRLSR